MAQNFLSGINIVGSALSISGTSAISSTRGASFITITTTSAAGDTYFANFMPSTGSGYAKFYQSSNNHLSLYMANASGTANVVLNSSGVSYIKGGNLIIGGSSDSGELLQVEGTGAFSGNVTISGSTNRSIILDYTGGSSGGYSWMSFKQNGTEQFRIFGSYDDDYLSFWNEQTSAHQLTLNADGSTTFAGAVNIAASQKIYLGGHTSRMQVYHTGSSGEAIVLNKEGNLSLVNQSHGDDIIFKTENSSGTVVTPLTLDSAGGATFAGTIQSDDITIVDGSNDVNLYLANTSYGIQLDYSAGDMFFRTNGATRLTIANGGNATFAGTVTASNLSGTNTGDQTTISGNAATATNITSNLTQDFGLNDNKLFFRGYTDTNHYLWNNAADFEELIAYTGTGFKITSSTGYNMATFAGTGLVTLGGSLSVGGTATATSYHGATSGYYFSGTDANWRMGINLTSDSGGLITASSIQLHTGGSGLSYGFQVFGHQTNTSPCFEVVPNTSVAASITNVRGNLYINNTLTIDNSRNLTAVGGTFAGDVTVDGSFKWATTNATSYTYSNADAAGLYIETAGSTAALSDMRFQARPAGSGNYTSIAIKPSNHSILFKTNATPALTLDSSQNATFAGNVIIPSSTTGKIDWGGRGSIVQDSSYNFHWSTNGTANVMWLMSATGYVGIGTATPDEKLDITGGYLKFNGGDYGIKGSASLTYYATSLHYFYTSGSTLALTLDASQNATFAGDVTVSHTSGDPTLKVINSSASQNALIHVGESNQTAYGLDIKYEGNLGNVFFDSRYNHATRPHMYFRMKTAGTAVNALTIDPSGWIGIGVTDPDSRLEIKGAAGGVGRTFKTTDASSNETFFILDGGRAGVTYWPFSIGIPSGTAVATNAKFQVEEAGLLTVLTSGNVGVGTVAPIQKLDTPNIVIGGAVIAGTYRANALFIDNNGGVSRFYSAGADGATKGSYQFNIMASDANPLSTPLTLNADNSATFGGNVLIPAGYVGRDGDNFISFATDDVLQFRVAASYRFRMEADNFRPYTDSTFDLGTSSYYFRHTYTDAITTTGDATFAGTVASGAATAFNISSTSGKLCFANDPTNYYIHHKDSSDGIVVSGYYGVSLAHQGNVKLGVGSGGISVTGTQSVSGDATFAADILVEDIRSRSTSVVMKPGDITAQTWWVSGSDGLTKLEKPYFTEYLTHYDDTDNFIRFTDNAIAISKPATFAGNVGVGMTAGTIPTEIQGRASDGKSLRLWDNGGTDILDLYNDGTNAYINTTHDSGAGNPLIIQTNSLTALTLDTSQNATFEGNVISKDTFYLQNGSGNRWQMLFDTNAFNLRYYNGSSWSADAFAIDTSNNATFAGNVVVGGNITGINGRNIVFDENNNNYIYALAGSSSHINIMATNSLRFATSASQTRRMTIDTAGRVSFGPDELDIQIDPASTNSNNNLIYLRGNASGDKSVIQMNHYGNADYHIGVGHVGDGKFNIANDLTGDDFVIDTAGKIGIGTASPASIVHIADATNPVLRVEDTTNNATVAMYATDSDLFMGSISNHPLAILTNDTAAITIDTSQNATFAGNIRTGTSNFAENPNFDNIVIEGAAHTGMTIFSGTSSDGGIYFGDSSAADGQGQIKYLHSSDSMTFATNDGAASLTLDSGLNATFAGNIIKGNLTISGTEIDLSSGDLTLDVAGNIYLSADGGNVILQDGATSFAEFGLVGGNFAIYSAISDADIVFKGNDGGVTVTAMTIDMSVGGKIGIGVAAPLGTLHIQNGATGQTPNAQTDELVIENTGNSGIQFLSGTTSYTGMMFGDSGSATRGQLYYDNASDSFTMITSATTGSGIFINSGGDVGMGTDSPTSKLDVREDANGVYTAYFYNSNNSSVAHGVNIQTASTHADAYAFRVNSASNTNALVVKGNALVGVGTPSPQTLVDIRSTSSYPELMVKWDSNNDSTAPTASLYLSPGAFSANATAPRIVGYRTAAFQSAAARSAGLKFGVAQNNVAKDAMWIAETQNVGIGTAVPYGKLHVVGTGTYNSVPSETIASDVIITSSEMTDSAYHSILQLVSVRQSLSTGSSAQGFLGFSTVDDSNGQGMRDAARIAIVNESPAARNSSTALGFWTNPGGVNATVAPTEKMRISSAGKVGIGTTTPDESLHITNSGGAKIILNSDANTADSGIYISEGADATPTQNGAYVYYDASENTFNIATGGGSLTDRLTIARDTGNATFAGNVELKSDAGNATKYLRIWNQGTATNDDAVLAFTTQASRTYSLGIHRDSGLFVLSDQDASVASGELITVDTSGNATFAGNVTVSKAGANLYVTSTSGTQATLEIGRSSDTKAQIRCGNTAANDFCIYVGGSNRLQILNSGNIGIGVTGSSRKVDIRDTSNSQNTVLAYNQGASFTGTVYEAITDRTSNSAFNLMNLKSSTTSMFLVRGDGNVGIGDATPSYKLDVAGDIRATADVIAYSDARVKDNITTIDNALDKVSKLRGVSYTRKDIDDKSTKIGVIAQEVIDVLPEVVSQDDEGKYSVAYGNMVGVLIEAIKDLKAEVEELKNSKCDGCTK